MNNSLGETAATLSVPTDDRQVRRTGLAILLVTFVGFGGWAAVAHLDSAAVAMGVVTVESHRKTIQHLEGGIVKEILVRDGDSVQRGAILLRLDDTQARARLEIIRSQYLAARALDRSSASKSIPNHIQAVDF